MAGDQPFEDRVLDRLSPLGDITSRPMFAGHGLSPSSVGGRSTWTFVQ
jgi:TfoX/Sxy family transcriptional regulator of competence genes